MLKTDKTITLIYIGSEQKFVAFFLT